MRKLATIRKIDEICPLRVLMRLKHIVLVGGGW